MPAAKNLLTRYNDIFGPDGFLNHNNIERKETIELLALSTIAGVDVLLLGDPGVGKTWVIEMITEECLVDTDLFSILLAKDMSADEVLGPRDIMAMKEGRISRLTDGYLPKAHYGYLDEVFKASPPMLNPLLDLLANRVLKVGGEVQDCSQLMALYMSSNELPDREDLMAFRDRIGVTYIVKPVGTPEGRREVTNLQLAYQSAGKQLDTSGLVPLTLAEILDIRDEVNAIEVPEQIRDIMVSAQGQWSERGHAPSQRRIGQMWRMIKAHAWMHGRKSVAADDLLPCQHMAWNDPNDAAKAREVVMEYASKFTRKANRIRETLEPVMSELEELRSNLDAAKTTQERDDLLDSGFKFLRQLRKLRKEAVSQISDGKKQEQDVSSLETVLAEMQSAHDWAEKALIGTDDQAEENEQPEEAQVP